MNENGDFSPSFLQLLTGTRRMFQYKQKVEQLSENVNEDNIKIMTKIRESQENLYQNQKELFATVLQQLESIIEARKIPPQITVPTLSFLQRQFAELVALKLKPVSFPYPPLCGANPWPNELILPIYSNVCAKIDNTFILTIVLGFDPEKYEYIICDASPLDDNEIKLINYPADQVIPLPTTVPARHGKSITYPLKSRVLALWYEGNYWTTEFYPATVVQQPAVQTPSSQKQGDADADDPQPFYVLKFEGTPTITAPIPEKFVVKHP